MTPSQRAQIANARKVVSDMRAQGHTDRNIEFALRQEGYAAAAIKAALEAE